MHKLDEHVACVYLFFLLSKCINLLQYLIIYYLVLQIKIIILENRLDILRKANSKILIHYTKFRWINEGWENFDE